MIKGRFQSLKPTEIQAYRKKQIDQEKEKRPMYGLGTHVPGKNSHRKNKQK